MADNLQAFEWNGINAQGKRVKGILRVKTRHRINWF
jgi:hypothetical protein